MRVWWRLSLLAALAFACAFAAAPFAFAQLDADPAAGNYGVIPDRTPALSVHNSDVASGVEAQEDELPSKYSSVEQGFVTAVHYQDGFGTCWAFSAIGALEASLLAHGQAASDLSERHLVYFTYHDVADPLGYTVGDATIPGKPPYMDDETVADTYLGAGGNPHMAAYILASWRGAADEEAAPYDALQTAYWHYREAAVLKEIQGDAYEGEDYPYSRFLEDTALDPLNAYADDAWHLTSFKRIDLRDSDDVKRAVMEYGGAAVLLQFDDRYFNYIESAYYYYGSYDTNHAGVIVGWDDDFDAEKFEYVDPMAGKEGYVSWSKTRKPSRNGAWLVKNSTGSWFGQDGYYWVSYDDVFARGRYSNAFVYEAAPADNYDNIYQHDGSCAATYNFVNSGGSIANVYTASANPEGAELLEAVSFALDDVNVDYSVQVYTGLRDTSNPESGTAMLAKPVEGHTDYAGYYTVALPSPVPLAQGVKYSVVVTLSHAGGTRVGYSVDASNTRWDWVTFASAVHARESFERDSAEGPWDDLSSSAHDATDELRCAARVKAFTRNAGLEVLPPADADDGGDGAGDSGGGPEAGSSTEASDGADSSNGATAADKPVSGASQASAKATNPMEVIARTKSVKASKLKSKARILKRCIRFKRAAHGRVSFAKVAKGSSSRLKVNKKTGAITVKKGTKRGTYRIFVKVRAAGDARYASVAKTIACTVRVR